MTRFHNIDGVHFQFTPEEEIARDEEEAQGRIEKIKQEGHGAKLTALTAKLDDDSITFEELKELMRLRG